MQGPHIVQFACYIAKCTPVGISKGVPKVVRQYECSRRFLAGDKAREWALQEGLDAAKTLEEAQRVSTQAQSTKWIHNEALTRSPR